MIPPDLHIHTDFSCDCEASMEDMCRAAIDLGLQEIGFAEHFDLIPEDPCYAFFRADDWWEALEACRVKFAGALRVRAGVELGEPHRYPREMKSLLEAYPWDYSLGSLHWVGDELIFDKKYFQRTPDAAYRDYFHELTGMASSGAFDVLAHMDVVKRFGYDLYGAYEPERYEDDIRRVLRTCAELGMALEVNTSSLRRPVKQIAPAGLILEWFRQEGGRWVTFGSDAHAVEHVGHGARDVVAAVRRAGFQAMASFVRREPQPVALEDQAGS